MVLSYSPHRFWETRDQRFPGSLSLSPRKAGRREPWERGCSKVATVAYYMRGGCLRDVRTRVV